MSANGDSNSGTVTPPEVPELPPRILSTYARLWQFETWLRRMVYVELRALEGDDWSKQLRNFDKSLEADKDLVHMPTPEQESLSYAPLSELRRLINENWALFKPYLPPQRLWDAKLDEISQVRNRVAHFRSGHVDDYQRLIQLLRDIDRGFWLFCTSYNDTRRISNDDPIASRLIAYNPFAKTVERKEGIWIGDAYPDVLSVSVGSLRRPWAAAGQIIDGQQGCLYDVTIRAEDRRRFDYERFLKVSKDIHGRVCHLCLEEVASSVRLTFPAVIGATEIIKVLEVAMDAAMHSVQRGPVFSLEGKSIQEVADSWPELCWGRRIR